MRPGTLSKIVTGNLSLDRIQDSWKASLDPVLSKNLVELLSVPTSASAAGVPGQMSVDSGFVYVCTAANTWKRAALSTW